MSIPLRSNQTTQGRLNAGARSLWRANGMKDEHFGRPIIAIANSFTQLVPGHVHLHSVGQFLKGKIQEAGLFAAEFNTIAIDDGIAMGHDGMRYSLPSREVIADSVEYMCNAHKVDALICIPNCDKIVPGMLMAAMRLNIPTLFVSGGPMEAGVVQGKKYNYIDTLVMSGDGTVSDADLDAMERASCPTCGSCSGMFTANSMNCLTEAIGMALPGQGTILATHVERKRLFEAAAQRIVAMTQAYYDKGDDSVLPRSIATRQAFLNAMAMDIAMGGSTNTILHLLAVARSAEVDFSMADIDALSRRVPCICKVAPNAGAHIEDVNRAGGVMGILGELAKAGLIDTTTTRADGLDLGQCLDRLDLTVPDPSPEAVKLYSAAPGNKRTRELGIQDTRYPSLDRDRETGCIRDVAHAFDREGGLAVLFGNIAEDGCVVKTAGVAPQVFRFKGSARVFDSQEAACQAILDGVVTRGDVVVVRYEGPKGGPGMQEMLYPTAYIRSVHLETECALITDGRFSGGSSGLSIGHISPEAAAGGTIALIQDRDEIEISIPDRRIRLCVSDEELAARRDHEEAKGDPAFCPVRHRPIPESLKAYAAFVSSADQGAVRILP